jgi:hypothetical protein
MARRLGHWLSDKLSQYLLKDTGEHRAYLCDFERLIHEVRPGDVLLIEGHNRISRIIKYITQSPWTHASLYIGHLHDIKDPKIRAHIRRFYHGKVGDQLIVESMLGQGNYIANLDIYRDAHVRICRPSDITHEDVQKVIEYTVANLGGEYNIRHFLDLGRFLLGSKLIPRRWFSSLFKRNPNKTKQDICSAMIARAFISVRFPILPLVRTDDKSQTYEYIHRNARLFAPCDFDYSPYFNIIKYPIYPQGHRAAYRRLPWNDELVSHDDHGVGENIDTPNSPPQP